MTNDQHGAILSLILRARGEKRISDEEAGELCDALVEVRLKAERWDELKARECGVTAGTVFERLGVRGIKFVCGS